MNKKLYLLRHSYAEITNDKRDIDRNLTMEGLNTVRALGRKLTEDKIDLDVIVASPSVRTTETAINLVEEIGINEQLINYKDIIYEASVRELLDVVTQIDSEHHHALLIGHNPSITFFAEYLTGAGIGNMHPCGLVTIRFENTAWEEVSQNSGIFVSYYHPSH